MDFVQGSQELNLTPVLLQTSHSPPQTGVIPFFNRMEKHVVKTYPFDFLFHLDPMDLPVEEHISTRDPSGFQEIQSNLQDIFSTPLDFYLNISPDTLIIPRIFCLIFKAPFRFSLPYPFLYSFACPSIWDVWIKNGMTLTLDQVWGFWTLLLISHSLT